jgi:hypothetical protein
MPSTAMTSAMMAHGENAGNADSDGNAANAGSVWVDGVA